MQQPLQAAVPMPPAPAGKRRWREPSSALGVLPRDLLLLIVAAVVGGLDRPTAMQLVRACVPLTGVCRHWRQQTRAALLQLPLAVRCNSPVDFAAFAYLDAAGASVTHLWLENTASGGDCPLHLCRHGPGLRLLAGLPAQSLPLVLSTCTQLRSLHLHLVADSFAVGGSPWRSMAALEELCITTAPFCYLTIDALPARLQRLSVTAAAAYCDVPILLGCPLVRLAAREVYLMEDNEANNASDVGSWLPLSALAETLGAAGVQAGHIAEINARSIWFHRPEVEEAEVHHYVCNAYVVFQGLHSGQQRVAVMQAIDQTQAAAAAAAAAARSPLHSLLPQPPPEVEAVFVTSEWPLHWLVAAAGTAELRACPFRPLWPLCLRDAWEDEQEDAMLLTLQPR